MKNILITGAGSFIGTSFEKYMQQFNEKYEVTTIDMRDAQWKNHDFSNYDAIFHVAGIAHADVSNVSEETKKLYYTVNCDLAVQTAEKYKKDLNGKNGHFIYMSSIIVYGEETNINKKRVITKDTKPNPSNFYGDSKLQAEINLAPLMDNNFKIALVRPPMIYGEGSKGNYQTLVKLALKVPMFPDVKNERSMLSIDTLCEFIKEYIDKQESGILLPQDSEYVRTSLMVKNIANENGRKIYLFSWLNWLIYLFGFVPGKIGKLVNKAFGNLVYENDN